MSPQHLALLVTVVLNASPWLVKIAKERDWMQPHGTTLHAEWAWPYQLAESPKMKAPRFHVFRSTPIPVTEPRKLVLPY